LQVIPTTARGGTEEYALTIAAEATRRGWEVIAAFPAVAALESLAKDYGRLGGRYRPLKVAIPKGREGNDKAVVFARLLRTARVLLRVRPELVQVVLPWPDAGLGPLLACGLFRTPTAVVFQIAGERHEFTGKTRRAYLWAKGRRQRWVAVSEQNRQALANGFGIDRSEIELTHNGARPEVFEQPDDPDARAAVRRELGLPVDAVLVLSVGRLHHQKGFDFLPMVVPHVVAEFPNVRFAIAGDGPDRESLERALCERGIADRVHVLGRRSDVPRLLAAADLFAFPTRLEGHPFALMEAMAAGVPVVTSAASGIPELVTDRENGVLFRPNDPCDFLEALRWALRHPEAMARMGEAGRARAREFTEEKMLRQTFELFARLTGSGGA
jgi:glycosyltransferase involved in cell wall biosynthesis